MSSDNITICPKCKKEDALFEYIESYPSIQDGVYNVEFRAECKNKQRINGKKCGFTYRFSYSEKVL